MIDIKLIRQNPKEIEQKIQTKEPTISLAEILSVDEEIRKLQTEVEQLKAERNALSKEIGLKKQRKEDVSSLMADTEKFGTRISALDTTCSDLEKKREELISVLPNIPLDEIPVSMDKEDNKCIKEVGQKKNFTFPIKNHIELNEKLGLFDFKRAVKISGAGWVIYKDLGARLEWALINYMLDIHRENGFMQIIPPLLVKPEILYGTGQLPKFKDQVYQIQDEDYNLYLIPTAEAALTGLHYDEILDEEELPIKYVSYTPCFRREAGAAGIAERGLIRNHQFNKVELYSLCKPEDSSKIFEEILASAELVLKGLGLHYRNMLLATGDMSFAAAKTVDIEVWLPGQNRYYEVSSVSNCSDFQARRAKTRFRRKGEKPELLHTLNGSGVATSRLMVAILENYQREDGSIEIPLVLRKYLENEMVEIKPLENAKE